MQEVRISKIGGGLSVEGGGRAGVGLGGLRCPPWAERSNMHAVGRPGRGLGLELSWWFPQHNKQAFLSPELGVTMIHRATVYRSTAVNTPVGVTSDQEERNCL